MLTLLALPLAVRALAARPSVLVTDGLAPAALTLLTEGGCDVVQQHLSVEELADGGLSAHDAVIIRSATSLNADAIAAGAAGSLRVGWSTRDASLELGMDARGFGYGATGTKSPSARMTEKMSAASDPRFGRRAPVS